MDTALQLMESENVAAGMERLVARLSATRKALSPSAWNTFAKWAVTHPIAKFVHADPFTHRAFTKPRGYAGDAVMMDYLYGFDIPPVAPETEPITHYTTRVGQSPQAVRHRRQILASAIDDVVVDRGGAIEVTALAAGHLREMALSSAAAQGLVNVTAIDQDEASLEVVDRDYRGLGARARFGSVRQILSGRLRLPQADLVYSAGLYDYLTQPVAERLTERLFDSVAPGGRLLLANFMPDLPDVGYMESFMDWHLIYRTDEDMRGLAAVTPPEEVERIRQFHDSGDNITYLEIRKRP